MALHQNLLQNIEKPFEYFHWCVKCIKFHRLQNINHCLPNLEMNLFIVKVDSDWNKTNFG